jgi:hypothetical protein
MTAQDIMSHRGRFQAQGDIEKSRGWSRDSPLPASQAHNLLNTLYEELGLAERRDRETAFVKAHEYIDRGAKAGGVTAPTKKTFPPNARRGQPRVDIEVLAGLAFVSEETR